MYQIGLTTTQTSLTQQGDVSGGKQCSHPRPSKSLTRDPNSKSTFLDAGNGLARLITLNVAIASHR
jgi:hypothetical protein